MWIIGCVFWPETGACLGWRACPAYLVQPKSPSHRRDVAAYHIPGPVSLPNSPAPLNPNPYPLKIKKNNHTHPPCLQMLTTNPHPPASQMLEKNTIPIETRPRSQPSASSRWTASPLEVVAAAEAYTNALAAAINTTRTMTTTAAVVATQPKPRPGAMRLMQPRRGTPHMPPAGAGGVGPRLPDLETSSRSTRSRCGRGIGGGGAMNRWSPGRGLAGSLTARRVMPRCERDGFFIFLFFLWGVCGARRSRDFRGCVSVFS